MTLFLVGYMGCGKSVVGSKLAEVLDYEFIDLDKFIEEKEGESIKKIFKNKGEIYFRNIENKYLNQVINFDNTVISLGGGTPCYGNNMNFMLKADNALVVYLKTSIQILVDRLFTEKSNRPLIAHLELESDLTEFVGKHLFERAPYYEQSSCVIKTNELTIDGVVDHIILYLF